jgi:WD40 repeat protein
MKKVIFYLVIISSLTLLLFFTMGGCTGTPSLFLNGSDADIAIFPQPGMVNAISAEYSPDKKRIISGQMDGSIKIWDTESGRMIKSISAHTMAVFSLTWTSNGKMFLSCDYETLKVWNAETFRELWSASGYSWSAVFSPDGRIIAAGTENGTVKLLNAVTGRELREITYAYNIIALRFSPDGKQLAISDIAGIIKLFDVKTGKVITTLAEQVHFKGEEAIGTGAALAFNSDGKYLAASQFGEKTVHVYNTDSGKELCVLFGHEDAVNSAVFSPDDTYIVTGSQDKTVRIWDFASGKELHKYSSNGTISSVSFKDNQCILATTAFCLVEVDLRNGEELRSFYGKTSSSFAVSLSPSGNIFRNNNIWPHDGSAPAVLNALTDLYPWAATYSPDGKLLAVVINEKESNEDESTNFYFYILLIEAENGNVLRKLSKFDNTKATTINISQSLPLSFSPDGKLIASGFLDGHVLVWNTESGELIWDRPLHNGPIFAVSFGPDGLIASCSMDGTLKIWNEQTLIAKTYSSFNNRRIINLAFSPNGKNIVITTGNEFLMLDIQSGKEIWRTEYYVPSTMAYNSRGNHILIGSIMGPYIMNAETGEIIQKLPWEGSSLFFINAAYSPDGKYFLISTMDGYSSLWDAETNREIAKYVSFEDGEWIVITSDGYYNASANGDQYLNLRIGNNVYGVDQYREIFYRPEIVQAILSGDTTKVAMSIKNAARITPPDVSIIGPDDSVSTLTTKLSVSINDKNNPIKTVRILVNGRLIGQDELSGFNGKGLDVGRTSLTVQGRQKKLDFELPVNLTPGNNIIDVLAFNGYSWSSQKQFSIYCESTQRGEMPNLWILAIGINHYEPSSKEGSLSCCVQDAEGIVEVFRRQEGIHYRKVNYLLITDKSEVKPTAVNIKGNLNYLSKAAPRDVAVLFLAGHGVDVKGNFVFLPSDAVIENGLPTASTTISNKEILDALGIPTRRLVFIDACHSGGISGSETTTVNNDYLIRALADSNAGIFTAATYKESAQEYGDLGHGVFTYNIIEGLKGKAKPDSNAVSVFELVSFVTKEVQKETRYRQNPNWSSSTLVDFPVVRTK